jgi:hypothetical protein
MSNKADKKKNVNVLNFFLTADYKKSEKEDI